MARIPDERALKKSNEMDGRHGRFTRWRQVAQIDDQRIFQRLTGKFAFMFLHESRKLSQSGCAIASGENDSTLVSVRTEHYGKLGLHNPTCSCVAPATASMVFARNETAKACLLSLSLRWETSNLIPAICKGTDCEISATRGRLWLGS